MLDSRDLADPAVISSKRKIEKLVQEEYHTYVNEGLVDQTKPITDPIKKNNLPLFCRPPIIDISITDLHLSSLKNDYSLFSRIFIASQTCDRYFGDFLAHENLTELSIQGKMRQGTKFDLWSDAWKT